ncbi:MAG: GTPase [Candidatus Shikimatogenerans sp. Ttur]|uniref:GTPase n=1 Tax=Candidatus Shikimatogenerans sp. Ttur TaxID=3158569 RepID=A0AAU7ZXY3_9FLAO
MYKSGYVILLGDVNVGKSSLINRFLKKQLLIVSGRKGSTINKILCILNINNTQIVFIDTPGFLNENFKKKSKYIFFLNKFDDVDIFLYIVIPSYKIQISNYKKNIIKKINKNKKKVFLIINKIELFSKKKILFTYFF